MEILYDGILQTPALFFFSLKKIEVKICGAIYLFFLSRPLHNKYYVERKKVKICCLV